MKIEIEESTSGLMNKLEFRKGNSKMGELALASYEKSDLQEIMKYSGNFDIPSGKFSPYLLTNFLDSDTFNKFTPEILEKIVFPTGSSSTLTDDSKTFGMIKILSNKYLVLIKVPKEIDSVIAKREYEALFTIRFETQDEISQVKLLYLIIDTYNDSEAINVSAQLFNLSKTAYRNKPRTVLRGDTLNQMIQESPKVGVLTDDNLLVGKETGIILGQRRIDPDSCQIYKSISNRNKGIWDITTVYSEGDQVLYHGETWVSLISGNLGVRPPGYTWEIPDNYQKSKINEVYINPTDEFDLSVSGKVAFFSGKKISLRVTPIKPGMKFKNLTDSLGNTIESKLEGDYVTFEVPRGVRTITVNGEGSKCEVYVYYRVDDTTYTYPDYTGKGCSVTFPDGTHGNSYKYESTEKPQISFGYNTDRFDLDKITHGTELSEQIQVSKADNFFTISDQRALDFYCIFLKSMTYQVTISGENGGCDFTPREPKTVKYGDTLVYQVYSKSELESFYTVIGTAEVTAKEVQKNEYRLEISNIRSDIQIKVR